MLKKRWLILQFIFMFPIFFRAWNPVLIISNVFFSAPMSPLLYILLSFRKLSLIRTLSLFLLPLEIHASRLICLKSQFHLVSHLSHFSQAVSRLSSDSAPSLSLPGDNLIFYFVRKFETLSYVSFVVSPSLLETCLHLFPTFLLSFLSQRIRYFISL